MVLIESNVSKNATYTEYIMFEHIQSLLEHSNIKPIFILNIFKSIQSK